ncbi:hypothetical protein CEXT_306441 [Caerostris extrusa]|uniref:Endonuclease/exonuclease/phosphatase domain-containing protein n=1 Tax=Caerostris extrusa TaxID=172846 RepID=A0AAV4UDB7_CAEEX|nr:hypothetical protein CEXT_306441 [Caerostris extrusa]
MWSRYYELECMDIAQDTSTGTPTTIFPLPPLETVVDISIERPSLSSMATARHNVLDFAIFKNIPFPATTVHHELSSDHLPCILDIKMNTKPHSTPNLFVTNWNDYNYNLQHTNLNPININNEDDADTAIKNFTNDMYAALNNSSNHKYLTKRGRFPNNIKT